MTIDALLARGHAAYLEALRRIHTVETMPIGVESVSVVTREDFDAHPALCREYAARTRSLYILNDFGGPEILMCRVTAAKDW